MKLRANHLSRMHREHAARLELLLVALSIAAAAPQIGLALLDITVPPGLAATSAALLLLLVTWILLSKYGSSSASIGELNEQVRLLQMTEEAARVGHWRLEFATNDLFWSDQTYQIYGIPKSQAPSLEDAIDAFHPEDRPLVANAVETARETGEPYSFSARLMQPNGETRHTEALARVEFDPSGKPAAIFGIFADRTEETLLRESLIEARNEAVVSADAKSQFLAKMSHEIRTPMNGIIGFADLLLGEDLCPKSQRMVEVIAESGNALTHLLNDILDLSKIEAGELQVFDEPTDIGHLADQIVCMFQPQADQKGLQLTSDIADNVPSNLLADNLRVRQILSNLIGNAVKFTESGNVHVSVAMQEGKISCRVSDSGPGIAPADLKHLFDPFFQCEQDDHPQSRGVGLGLAISHQLATLMNGKIEVRSALGKGTIFEFLLPVRLAPVCSDRSRYQPPSELMPNQRVLLAEDFDINQILIGEMAEKAGIELDLAENGAEAIEMIRDAQAQGRPYQLVLMDIQMPLLDGISATKQLREKGFSKENLPIVALSANAFPENVEECMSAGMQGHLAKPITYTQFKNELARWLSVNA